jgi:hypothetical protein
MKVLIICLALCTDIKINTNIRKELEALPWGRFDPEL